MHENINKFIAWEVSPFSNLDLVKASQVLDLISLCLVGHYNCIAKVVRHKFIQRMFPRIEQQSLGSTGCISKFYKCSTPLSKLKYCNFAEEVSLIARLKKVQDFLET